MCHHGVGGSSCQMLTVLILIDPPLSCYCFLVMNIQCICLEYTGDTLDQLFVKLYTIYLSIYPSVHTQLIRNNTSPFRGTHCSPQPQKHYQIFRLDIACCIY